MGDRAGDSFQGRPLKLECRFVARIADIEQAIAACNDLHANLELKLES